MKLDASLPEVITGMLHQEFLTIFLFHGVVKKNDKGVRNYNGKHITQDLFYKAMRSLKQKGNALSMDEVFLHLSDRNAFPANAYAVTFDDGFENNISVAAPILDDLDIPATIYITTDFISKNTMSWADRLDFMVDKSDQLSVKLPWNNEVISIRNDGEKIDALKSMREFVKSTPGVDLNKLIEDIAESLNTYPVASSDHPYDRKMDWGQVQMAANSDFLIIGGHSHTHPILSFIDDEALNSEIKTSIYLMNEKAGVGPDHYSYPEGLHHCFNNKVIEKLISFGVTCCPTAMSGNNRIDADPFFLKREMIING